MLVDAMQSSYRKFFLITFGWNENVVLSLIPKYAIKSGDVFMLLLPSGPQDPRTERALKTLDNYFSMHLHDVKLVKERVPLTTFFETILYILGKIIAAAKEFDKVFVNVSGGMRILVLATFSAALIARSFYPGKIEFTELEVEAKPEPITLPPPPLSFPIFERGDKMEVSRKILEILEQRRTPASMDELLRITGKSRTTLSRYLSDLEQKGLIRSQQVGKRKLYEITETGRMYIEILRRYYE